MKDTAMDKYKLLVSPRHILPRKSIPHLLTRTNRSPIVRSSNIYFRRLIWLMHPSHRRRYRCDICFRGRCEAKFISKTKQTLVMLRITVIISSIPDIFQYCFSVFFSRHSGCLGEDNIRLALYLTQCVEERVCFS